MPRRTNEDRAKLVMGCKEVEGHCCWDYNVYQQEFWQDAEQNASTIFDAFQKVFYKHFNGETPFTYDLRRGQTEAVIAYVNAGANDFNCVRDLSVKPLSDISTPSLHVASLFGTELYGYAVNGRTEHEEHLDDLLYIYKGLRTRGLNHAVIEQYKAANPEVTMTEIFTLMDKYMVKPEKGRWDHIAEDLPAIQKIVSPSMAQMQQRYETDRFMNSRG